MIVIFRNKKPYPRNVWISLFHVIPQQTGDEPRAPHPNAGQQEPVRTLPCRVFQPFSRRNGERPGVLSSFLGGAYGGSESRGTCAVLCGLTTMVTKYPNYFPRKRDKQRRTTAQPCLRVDSSACSRPGKHPGVSSREGRTRWAWSRARQVRRLRRRGGEENSARWTSAPAGPGPGGRDTGCVAGVRRATVPMGCPDWAEAPRCMGTQGSRRSPAGMVRGPSEKSEKDMPQTQHFPRAR